MNTHLFIKQDVLNEVNNAGKAVAYSYPDLRTPFGFFRMDGEEFLLRKILHPSLTEESASYLSEREIHDNIEQWCALNNIYYRYDAQKDMYVFLKQ